MRSRAQNFINGLMMMVVAVALWFQSLLMADCYLWSIIFNLCLLSKNMRSLHLLLRQIFDTDTFASGFIRGTAVHSHWHCLSMHIMCKMANDNCDLWILDLDLKGQKLEDPSSWNGLHNHSAAQDSKRCSNPPPPSPSWRWCFSILRDKPSVCLE